VLVALSARSQPSLRALAAAIAEEVCDEQQLVDLAHSSIVHRDHHVERAAVVVPDAAKLRERLRALADGQSAPGGVSGRGRTPLEPLAFVCSGQGPQWWAMGRQLFGADAAFRRTIEEIDALMAPHAPWSLIDEVFRRDEAASRIDETWLTQPGL